MLRQILLISGLILLIFGGADAQKKRSAKPVKKQPPKPIKVINYIQDKDEYAVYEAVLRERFPDKIGKTIVINKEVTGCSSIIDQQTEQQFSREVLEDLFKDCYAKKNGYYELVPNLFQLGGKVVLITETEVEKFFNASCNLGWKNFYKKYPDSNGNASFSRIGFDSQKNYAVVSFGNQSACLAGQGQLIFLQKEDGIWKIKKSETTWVS